MKKSFLVFFIFILLLLLISCSNPNRSQSDVLYVKPIELFVGNSIKFKPFLGSMSGAVQYEYKGNRNSIKAKMEVWENGEMRVFDSIGGAVTQIDGSDFNGEFIVSVKEIDNDNVSKSTYVIRTVTFDGQGGTSSFEFQVDSNEKHTGKMTINNNESLYASEGEEIAVWGMQATSKNGMSTIDFTPEKLKTADWAMIFKIYSFEEE